MAYPCMVGPGLMGMNQMAVIPSSASWSSLPVTDLNFPVGLNERGKISYTTARSTQAGCQVSILGTAAPLSETTNTALAQDVS
ncbi:hypothetical protein BMS3Abin05_01128 [bacterium BMS3Abin05]|nr:hypothetical protein BMS3Abin05_01128 [bacterium BMS3Abin05]